MPNNPYGMAIFCTIGGKHLLVSREISAQLDRKILRLPRLHPDHNSQDPRPPIDLFLESAGLVSRRRPMTNLGAFHNSEHESPGIFIYALDVPPPTTTTTLQHGFEAVPLPELSATKEAPIVEALAIAAAHVYFTLPRTKGRLKDYEVFAPLNISNLRDDYINFWFPEAQRELEAFGLSIDIDAHDPNQPILKIEGRNALAQADIDFIRTRLIDLARHVKGRFWITEIIDGEESVLDYADPTSEKLITLS